MMSESHTLPFTGQTTVTDIGGGLYRIDSFSTPGQPQPTIFHPGGEMAMTYAKKNSPNAMVFISKFKAIPLPLKARRAGRD